MRGGGGVRGVGGAEGGGEGRDGKGRRKKKEGRDESLMQILLRSRTREDDLIAAARSSDGP